MVDKPKRSLAKVKLQRYIDKEIDRGVARIKSDVGKRIWKLVSKTGRRGRGTWSWE
jgi:hypothetical protein